MDTVALPSYNLSPPTEEDARSSLTRLCCSGADDAKWERLRSRAGVSDDSPLSLEELSAIAESCVSQPGCERVFGISLMVRIQTYLTLREQLLGTRVA